jgi:hypothetical protein
LPGLPEGISHGSDAREHGHGAVPEARRLSKKPATSADGGARVDSRGDRQQTDPFALVAGVPAALSDYNTNEGSLPDLVCPTGEPGQPVGCSGRHISAAGGDETAQTNHRSSRLARGECEESVDAGADITPDGVPGSDRSPPCGHDLSAPQILSQIAHWEHPTLGAPQFPARRTVPVSYLRKRKVQQVRTVPGNPCA